MQNQDNLHPDPGVLGQSRTRTREKTPIKDEFTEFSQYGSRFMLNQMPDTARRERNFVEQIQENKIFKKVASTCQKHYRKTSAPAPPPGLATDLLPPGSVVSEDRAAPLRREASAGQLSSCKDLSAGGVAGPAPAPGTQPILTILAQQPSTIVQVVPVQTVDTAAITLAAPLAPGTDLGPLMEEPQENGQGQEISTNGTAATSHESPPQISIPSPSRRSPSPTPSFSSFMDMSFDSCGQRTPTKSDQFLNIYHDNENSLLQTPPRPAPSPSPIFSQDLSISSWSLNFDSPIKSLSLPLPFNDDSQCSTISTSSEVSHVES